MAGVDVDEESGRTVSKEVPDDELGKEHGVTLLAASEKGVPCDVNRRFASRAVTARGARDERAEKQSERRAAGDPPAPGGVRRRWGGRTRCGQTGVFIALRTQGSESSRRLRKGPGSGSRSRPQA